MKMFFIFLSVAVLGITSDGRRISRQIWPVPNSPNYYWNDDGPRDDPDFFDYGNFWMGPPRLDQPPRNPNNINNNLGGGRNEGNQNRRTTTTTTTENLGPITSTPTTIHYAPENCNCPMTQQFNPVCGTDGNTYRNQGLLNCYQRCGTNVSRRRLGRC